MSEENLRAEVAQLREQLAEQNKMISELQKENKILHKEIVQLRKELRKYRNENTPSGALPPHLKDELNKITTEKHESKEKNGKSAKMNRRNKRKKEYDRKEIYTLEKCPCCDSPLKKRKKKIKRRITHLKLPEAEEVLHESETYYCKNCDKEITAPVPNTLPKSKHDLDIHLLIILLYVNGVTQRKTMEILNWFGLSICNSSINNAIHRVQRYLGDRKYKELEEELRKSLSCGADETGWRNKGKTHYIWAVTNARTAFYKIENSRKHDIAKKLPTGKSITCDGYRAYDKTGKDIQRCWSHLLRKMRNADYFDSEDGIRQYKEFVKGMSVIYKASKLMKKMLKGEKMKRKREVVARLDGIMRKFLLIPRKQEKNLLSVMDYILKYEGEWFTFILREGTEPTNNRTERMLRPLVIRRKVSQHSWSDDGKDGLAVTQSIYQTCKLRNENFMDLIKTEVEQGIYGRDNS